MDQAKLGALIATAYDDIDRLIASGDISDEAEIGAAVLVVAFDKKTPDDAEDRHLLRSVTTQVFCFSEPEHIYVQLGLLEMALENYSGVE